MPHFIISIDAPKTDLSCRDGKLVAIDDKNSNIPLEDIASIVVTSFSARIHSNLLIQASKHGVGMIICERFKPTSIVMPAERSADTLLTRRHLNLPVHIRSGLWTRTIAAKCNNQRIIASIVAPSANSTHSLNKAARAVSPRKEGGCAKLFWSSISAGLAINGFSRGRKLGGLNDLLNYGYAVLLSCVLQNLYATGLDPTVGISHAIRERCAPLAYDLMEPFRPWIDWRIFNWVKEQPKADAFVVTGEYRRWITSALTARLPCANGNNMIEKIQESAFGFKRSVLSRSIGRYKPWTLSDSKWAG